MRQVLKFESLWLKEVRYQFAFGLREEVFDCLKMYLKYRRVQNARKMTKYAALQRQLNQIVEDSRLRQAQALVYHQRRTQEHTLKALSKYMQHSLCKKAKIAKANRFARHKLQQAALTDWRTTVAMIKRIKGDKLLWQAHSSNNEFFSVSVKVAATMENKRMFAGTRTHHFYLPQPEQVAAYAKE